LERKSFGRHKPSGREGIQLGRGRRGGAVLYQKKGQQKGETEPSQDNRPAREKRKKARGGARGGRGETIVYCYQGGSRKKIKEKNKNAKKEGTDSSFRGISVHCEERRRRVS